MMKRILSFGFGLFLIIALLISSVGKVVFDHGFYLDLYQRIDLAEQVNVSESDLEDSIFMMTDYVEGKRDDLNDTVFWKGEVRPTFNEKEIRHMKDVRHLWLSARMVMIVSWILCALCLILILILEGLRGVRSLFSGLKEAFVCLMVVLVFFGFWCLIDFTGFWTWFHTIVFPGNMDWLLDPATDFMIVICPEQMFSDMIARIALTLLASLVPILLVMNFLKRNEKTLELGEEELRLMNQPSLKDLTSGRKDRS